MRRASHAPLIPWDMNLDGTIDIPVKRSPPTFCIKEDVVLAVQDGRADSNHQQRRRILTMDRASTERHLRLSIDGGKQTGVPAVLTTKFGVGDGVTVVENIIADSSPSRTPVKARTNILALDFL